jgi:hypothetical protein
MTILHRIVRLARALRAAAGGAPVTAKPELWCRPATVLALRDRKHAPACLAGWR